VTLSSDSLKFILPSAGSGVTGGTARPWTGPSQTRHLSKREEVEENWNVGGPKEWPQLMRRKNPSTKVGREIQGLTMERGPTSDLSHKNAVQGKDKGAEHSDIYPKSQNKSQLHILTDIWSIINSKGED